MTTVIKTPGYKTDRNDEEGVDTPNPSAILSVNVLQAC
jgi:hypothetical protein